MISNNQFIHLSHGRTRVHLCRPKVSFPVLVEVSNAPENSIQQYSFQSINLLSIQNNQYWQSTEQLIRHGARDSCAAGGLSFESHLMQRSVFNKIYDLLHDVIVYKNSIIKIIYLANTTLIFYRKSSEVIHPNRGVWQILKSQIPS